MVPPVETRFKPGNNANPGGNPKGSKYASPRRALKRLLARGAEKDSEAESDDERVGELSLAVAEEIIAAARAGNAEKVRALAQVFDQAEGKPLETRQDIGATEQVFIIDAREDTPALPPGIE